MWQQPTFAHLASILIATSVAISPQSSYLVERIIDGDTVVLSSLGTVRLIGVDTPETVDPRKPVAAVGIRAIVEAVCRHKKGNLKQRIDDLVRRGLLTKMQARVLHKTRFLGNKAAHEAKPSTGKTLEASMRIAEHLLTSVYLISGIAKTITG